MSYAAMAKSNGQTIVAPAAMATRMPLDYGLFTRDGYNDIVGYTLTVNTPGIYEINWYLHATTPNDNVLVDFRVRVNGSFINNSHSVMTLKAGEVHFTGSTMVLTNRAATIDMVLFPYANDVTLTFANNQPSIYLGAKRLSDYIY
jgi:hypothetical protein